MIKIEEKNSGKYLQVTGNPAEVMLFYTFWQSKLWPDWMDHTTLDVTSDYAHKQHTGVIKAINNGDPILLANDSKVFQDAYRYALNQSNKLNIKYQVYELQLRMVFEN